MFRLARSSFFIGLACFLTCAMLRAATEKVLYTFQGISDGDTPTGNLVFDSLGNLYGTTYQGGLYNGGIVYELLPGANGRWSKKTLYDFCSQIENAVCKDGEAPNSLSIDAAGNLYGTTFAGGLPCDLSFYANSCGLVFELSPPTALGGPWTYQVLYEFCKDGQGSSRCLDGGYPSGPLVFDHNGNLYGTAQGGGTGHYGFGAFAGAVFELSQGSSGWSERVLYSFCSQGQGGMCSDGADASGPVVFDSSGSLYGTTASGGDPNAPGGGAIFKLSQQPGKWTETVLLGFRNDGVTPQQPSSGVVIGPGHFLYGTLSEFGDQPGTGAVFRLSESGGKANFVKFSPPLGTNPLSNVIYDSGRQVLYGNAAYGGVGAYGPGGTVYQIDKSGKVTTLYNFCSEPNCTDGWQPESTLIEDEHGNLFGSTYLSGVVYEIIP